MADYQQAGYLLVEAGSGDKTCTCVITIYDEMRAYWDLKAALSGQAASHSTDLAARLPASKPTSTLL